MARAAIFQITPHRFVEKIIEDTLWHLEGSTELLSTEMSESRYKKIETTAEMDWRVHVRPKSFEDLRNEQTPSVAFAPCSVTISGRSPTHFFLFTDPDMIIPRFRCASAFAESQALVHSV